MKLYFCDLCNESIPLQDIKENRAATIQGKIFCRKCNPLNELATEPQAARPAGSGGGGSPVLSAVVLLLAVGVIGGGFFLYDLLDRRGLLDDARADRPADITNARLDRLDGSLRDLDAKVAAATTANDSTKAVHAVSESLDKITADVARLDGQIQRLQETVQGKGDLREQVDRMALRLDESQQKVTDFAAQIAQIQATLTEVADRPAVMVAPTTTDPSKAGDPSVAAPDPELLAILDRLTSKAPLERWEAVDRVRRRKDKTLAPYVMPLLDDRDPLVRAQAIYTLGVLSASDAVPKLIKLLRDDVDTVREEALSSLITITGQNLRFAVDGPKDEREKGIKKWEDWLAKNGKPKS
jgi:hypothetical protein